MTNLTTLCDDEGIGTKEGVGWWGGGGLYVTIVCTVNASSSSCV